MKHFAEMQSKIVAKICKIKETKNLSQSILTSLRQLAINDL